MEATRDTLLVTRTEVLRHSHGRRLGIQRAVLDWMAERLFVLAVIAVSALVIGIGATLAVRSWPLLNTYSLRDLLMGQVWQPMHGLFGFAPFIAGSVVVTVAAMALAVAPAILSGIYLAEYVASRTRTVLKPVIDLLVGIPSVVYGLWGILFIVPLVRDHLGPWSDRTLGQVIPFFSRTNPSGYGLLAAGFVLAVMVFPLIVAVTEEVMRSVPREMREALLSLGATRWETTKCVVRHASLPGIFAAVVLGFSRAFGETLAVMMVVGNVARFPQSLFDAAYPLPALIANNYGEMMSVPLYESALMGAALLLLVVVVSFNVGARLIVERLVRRGGA
jgi:phosphate transport system permease protein